MNLFVNFLLSIGIFAGAIILFVLYRRKVKSTSDYILIAIFILLGVVPIYVYGEVNDISFLLLITFLPMDTIGYLIGPLLYIYIHSIYGSSNDQLRKKLWHFVPAILYLLLVAGPTLVSIIQPKATNPFLDFLEENELILQVQAVYLLVYLTLSLIAIHYYNKAIKDSFSTMRDKDLGWVKRLIYGLIIVMFVQITSEVLNIVSSEAAKNEDVATSLALVVTTVYLGFYGIQQQSIELPPPSLIKLKGSPKENHHLARASDAEIEELKNLLMKVLAQEKPYKRAQLTLQQLAEMLPTSERKLSALLNHYMNTTFYDLINSYRVEEVVNRLKNGDASSFTLLGLAYDSGFSSKTTFNRLFKRQTGYTPSTYKKKIDSI